MPNTTELPKHRRNRDGVAVRPVIVRPTETNHQRIERLARANKRSIPAQIELMIDFALSHPTFDGSGTVSP